MARPEHVQATATERALSGHLQELYEGGDRYRPDRPTHPYGLAYTLLTKAGPVLAVRWYRTLSMARAALVEARAGRGWLGQQLAQGSAVLGQIIARSRA